MKGTVVLCRSAPTLLGALALLGAGWLSHPAPGCAQATPFVPVGDPAYRDLDVLLAMVAGGWEATEGSTEGPMGGSPVGRPAAERAIARRSVAGSLIRGQRPYSRMTFARVVAEARAQLGAAGDAGVAGAGAAKPRVAEALARLEARFTDELAFLGPDGEGACPEEGRGTRLREISLDATAADSPPRAIPWQLTSAIDADVAPLLQRNQGRALADGGTLGAEVRVETTPGCRVAMQLAPRVWVEDGGSARADAALVEGYARALVGNLSVTVGRMALRHGHARELGPVLSSNPRGLDAVRLSMERSAHLPWILRGLGPASFTALLAHMGDDQDTPGSKLIVFEGAVRPHANLELGWALLNHQGGGVDPDATFGERLLDGLFLVPRRFFPFLPDAQVLSDKAAGLDARLTLPEQGLELFVEMLTTDDHDLFAAPKQALWHDAAWTVGARASALGGPGRWDVWAEASRVGLLPYTHHEFTSGLTLDRRVLGNPLGPLGTGLTAGVDRVGARGTLSLGGAVERYSGDRYRNPDDGLSHRFRVADNPDEIRWRGTVEWSGHAGPRGLRAGARLGWERVTRFALGSASRSNVMAQVRAAYSF